MHVYRAKPNRETPTLYWKGHWFDGNPSVPHYPRHIYRIVKQAAANAGLKDVGAYGANLWNKLVLVHHVPSERAETALLEIAEQDGTA